MSCFVCRKDWPTSEFKPANLKAHRDQNKKSPLVCRECEERGCTSRVPQLRKCSQCAVEYGIAKFDKKQWDNCSQRGEETKLVCLGCRQRDAQRLSRLHTVARKSSYRCTCHKPVHDDKCPLKPVVYGELRWPGKDCGVSLDDKVFLDGRRPDWWIRLKGGSRGGR